MVRVFYTGTRPNSLNPFYEQTDDGISKRRAIKELVNANPGIVASTSTLDDEVVKHPEDLTWSLEIVHPDVESFRAMLTMVNTWNPEFRNIRANYYKQNGHSLLIEYLIDGMEERGLIASITPEMTTIRLENGSITTRVAG
jgi:hypothetical protein